MSATPPIPDAEITDPAAWAQGVLRRQVMMLERLAESGLELAEAIKDQAIEAPAEQPAELAMAFSRVARAVRMTALLQSRLLQDMEQARRREAVLTPEQQEKVAEDDARRDPAYAHKGRVEAIVARVARAQGNPQCGDDEERVERIINEAADRLDDEDIYGDVLTRPVGELVSLICRDLGLAPDWAQLREEAWAKAEMASGAEGSPFVTSPNAVALAGGGPPADPGAMPGEERGWRGQAACNPRLPPITTRPALTDRRL